MPPSQEIKKLKKAHKRRLAAEANAKRAEEFRLNGGKKRKANQDDDDDADAADHRDDDGGGGGDGDGDAAHDALEAAVAAGDAAAAARKKNTKSSASNKKAKKQKGAAAAVKDEDDDAGGAAAAADKPSAEEVAAFREEHAIKVAEGTPDPIIRFKDAPFPKKLIAALLKQGYTSPSPIQAQAWSIAVTGRDVVAVAKTGSGKTCGFLLPALSRIVKQGASAAPDMEMVDGRFRPAAVVPAAIVLVGWVVASLRARSFDPTSLKGARFQIVKKGVN